MAQLDATGSCCGTRKDVHPSCCESLILEDRRAPEYSLAHLCRHNSIEGQALGGRKKVP